MTTPPVTHPMVGAYLNELDRLLAGIDPGERAEVLSGVREHLVGALAGRTAVTDEDVRGVLAELGPPQAVADEAYAGRGTGAAPTGTRPSVMTRSWVPVVVAVAQLIGLLMACLTVGGSSAMVSTNIVDGVEVSSELTGSPLWLIPAVFVLTLPLWATVAVLVSVSPLWVGREKAAAMLLIPAAAVLLGVLPLVGYVLAEANGVFVGAWVALGVVLLGGGWLVIQLTRRGACQVVCVSDLGCVG